MKNPDAKVNIGAVEAKTQYLLGTAQFLPTLSIVRILYPVRVLYPVRSPWVRSPRSLFYTDRYCE